MKVPEYTIYGTGAVNPDPRWHLAPHSHSFHEVIVIIRGRLLLNAGSKKVVAKAGDVLFYRAGLIHEETSDPKAPFQSVFVSFHSGHLLPGVPLHLPRGGERIRQLVTWIVEDERGRHSAEMKRPYFEALMGELLRLAGAESNPWLESVLAYARANLAQPLSLDDLARFGKMSRFAFIRKFKRLSGRTPMEELRHIRLDQARMLLLTTSMPIKMIAPAVGIGDEYQLSKLFRSRLNLSPRDLRRRSAGVKLLEAICKVVA